MKPHKASQELPGGFAVIKELNLSKNLKLLLFLNLAGLGLFVLFGMLLMGMLQWARSDFIVAGTNFSLNASNLGTAIVPLLVLLGVIFAMVFLHEGVHGLFFWTLTGARPKFGFKGSYAYAAAPNWYIPKANYLIVSLAPLVVITLLGFGTLLIVPTTWILPVLLLVTMNASGAIGDLYAFFWIWKQPAEVLIQDYGDRMKVYGPNGVDEQG